MTKQEVISIKENKMDWKFETDKWPFVPTKNFNKIDSIRSVRVIVIHSMEADEKGDTAEKIAKHFATTKKKKSAHICIDNNSIVQCVLDNNVAWAAPGANHDGIQIELAGYAAQKQPEWLDQYSTLVLENAAEVIAQYCLKYSIPIRQLTIEQLKDKKSKGIVSHSQVSEAFKMSSHTDPGEGFPWQYFLDRVSVRYELRKKKLAVA
ncbi:N-acetylmuramoyl-L-alanine amidase [Nitrosomonas ureae]|nr:peptidoglycan recognition family protein [Nitrosomonas ureae]